MKKFKKLVAVPAWMSGIEPQVCDITVTEKNVTIKYIRTYGYWAKKEYAEIEFRNEEEFNRLNNARLVCLRANKHLTSEQRTIANKMYREQGLDASKRFALKCAREQISIDAIHFCIDMYRP